MTDNQDLGIHIPWMTHNFIGAEKHKIMIDSGTTQEDEPEDVRTVSGTTPDDATITGITPLDVRTVSGTTPGDVTITGTIPLDVKIVYRTTQEDERTISGTSPQTVRTITETTRNEATTNQNIESVQEKDRRNRVRVSHPQLEINTQNLIQGVTTV